MSYLVISDTKEFVIDGDRASRAIQYLEAGLDVYRIAKNGRAVTLKPLRVKVTERPAVKVERVEIEATAGNEKFGSIERVKPK